MKNSLKEIQEVYSRIKPEIENRITEFKKIREKASDKELFHELVFCIMTPQSKAKSCGKALEILKMNNLVFNGTPEEISDKINIVRFRNNKARYIVEARAKFTETNKFKMREILFSQGNVQKIREWLVKNIKGIGYKEASHFLRNTGFGDEIAILDRHILKNMIISGILKEKPKTLSPAMYMEIEKKLIDFSKRIKIPADHLDFVWWYKEAGEVYK
jgi:N-glycosylase/DNA lyase